MSATRRSSASIAAKWPAPVEVGPMDDVVALLGVPANGEVLGERRDSNRGLRGLPACEPGSMPASPRAARMWALGSLTWGEVMCCLSS